MKQIFLFISLVIVHSLSCKKATSDFVKATVISKGGCFTDSYLVTIDNPDFSRHSFLRSSLYECSMPPCYNCSNAVFIKLPDSYTDTGTRISFLFVASMASCLSLSEAPQHIKIKNLSRL